MSSLPAQFNFTVSSSKSTSSNFSAYFAFNKEGKYFETGTSPYYWQVSFPRKIVVSSYKLGGNSSWISYATKWEISYSNDNKTFVPVQNDTWISPQTIQTFRLNRPISCKHFRITAKEIKEFKSWIFTFKYFNFYKFDLLGSIKQYTCNNKQIKAQLIMNALIMVMQPITTR